MIKVFNPTKEEVWRNPKDAKEPYSCCCVVLGCLGYPGLLLGYSNVLGVSWGQPLANGCIHIGINTNAPGGCFAQQQVSDDDCPDGTPCRWQAYPRLDW